MRIRRPRGQRKTTCKCGNPVRTGQRNCTNCHNSYMRKNRPVHSDLKPEAKKKANCRAYANVYIRRGHIQKRLCEICGESAQMHHEDYNKPLEIKWLCRNHHLEYHKQQNASVNHI